MWGDGKKYVKAHLRWKRSIHNPTAIQKIMQSPPQMKTYCSSCGGIGHFATGIVSSRKCHHGCKDGVLWAPNWPKAEKMIRKLIAEEPT